jgi:hypothetical protein
MVALEAAVNDWLPCVRIASWPGAPGDASEEAEDTSVVRPVSASIHNPSLGTERHWEAGLNGNGARKETANG